MRACSCALLCTLNFELLRSVRVAPCIRRRDSTVVDRLPSTPRQPSLRTLVRTERKRERESERDTKCPETISVKWTGARESSRECFVWRHASNDDECCLAQRDSARENDRQERSSDPSLRRRRKGGGRRKKSVRQEAYRFLRKKNRVISRRF